MDSKQRNIGQQGPFPFPGKVLTSNVLLHSIAFDLGSGERCQGPKYRKTNEQHRLLREWTSNEGFIRRGKVLFRKNSLAYPVEDIHHFVPPLAISVVVVVPKWSLRCKWVVVGRVQYQTLIALDQNGIGIPGRWCRWKERRWVHY